MSTLISLIIPVYNLEKIISNTLVNLFSQINSSFEIIIIDDGSIDNTYSEITNLCEQYQQLQIKIFQQEKKGVICDSVDIKTQAFAEIYREYGKIVENNVVKHHLENGGISRYKKFKHWHKEYLSIDITVKELEELAHKFSGLVFNKVLEANYIDGVIDTLNMLLKFKVPSYIVSATPENEIREIVSIKGLNDFFIEVYGSPKSKASIVKELIDKEKYTPSKCLFIGDALSDFEAARYNKIQFLGILHNYNNKIFPESTKTKQFVNVDEYL